MHDAEGISSLDELKKPPSQVQTLLLLKNG